MNNKFYLLILLILLLYLIINFTSGNSYISNDSLSYFEIAEKLPYIETSLFPILYPLFLKILNFIFNDYTISYKFLSITLILISYYIPYRYNFLWKQIWCILSFSSFLNIYLYAWSEILLIPLILLFTIINYKFLNEEISYNKFIISISVIMFLMTITKYNSLFFLFSMFLFSLISKKNRKAYFISSLIAFGFIAMYLLNNYFITNLITGQRPIPSYDTSAFLKTSISNIFLSVNPFNTQIISFLNTITSLLNGNWKIPYLILGLSSLILIVITVAKAIKKEFTSLMIISAFCFLFLSLISGVRTSINFLDSRLLLGFYLLFFLCFISVFQNNSKVNKILYFCSITSLLIYIVN